MWGFQILQSAVREITTVSQRGAYRSEQREVLHRKTAAQVIACFKQNSLNMHSRGNAWTSPLKLYSSILPASTWKPFQSNHLNYLGCCNQSASCYLVREAVSLRCRPRWMSECDCEPSWYWGDQRGCSCDFFVFRWRPDGNFINKEGKLCSLFETSSVSLFAGNAKLHRQAKESGLVVSCTSRKPLPSYWAKTGE